MNGESVFYFTTTDGQIYKQGIATDERVIIIKEGDKLRVKYDDVAEGEDTPLVKQIRSFTFITENTTDQ